jgi:transposase
MRPPSLNLEDPDAKRRELLALVEQTTGAAIGVKVAALLLLLEGQRPGWIVEVLGLTRMSLNRWIHSANEQGVDSLVPRPKPGRPAALSAKVRRELEAHLERSPQEFGLNRVQWDGPTLVVHLKRRFGISLKVRQAQSWMHQLGYRMKRASHAYLQAHSEDARRFQRALKKTAHT